MASGGLLFNDANERRRWLSQEDFKHVIGGEMEGWGLFVSADEDIGHRVNWVVIKGICDWGYKKVDGWQAFAAEAAVDVLAKCLAEDDQLLVQLAK